MKIPTDSAHLIGIILGLFFFGVYVAVFCATLPLLRGPPTKSPFVPVILVVIFALCLGYYVLATWNIYLAFVTCRITPGTIQYLNSWKNPYASAKDVLYLTNLLLADCVLTWRLFILWRENKIALIAAAIFLFGGAVCGGFISYYECMQAIVGDDRYVHTVYRWTTAGTAMSLMLNLGVTGLIAGRLIWWKKESGILGRRTRGWYQRVIFVIIQSGAMYGTLVLLQLFIYTVGIDGAIWVFIYASPAIIGLTPTALIFQLKRHRERELDVEARAKPYEGITTPWGADLIGKVEGGGFHASSDLASSSTQLEGGEHTSVAAVAVAPATATAPLEDPSAVELDITERAGLSSNVS